VIFNSKQLDELEQKHDGSGGLEDSEQDKGEEGADAAMEWRVQLIEEGAENVKRAKARPVDESFQYDIDALLFDRESRRFGRVQVSVPGYLRIGYLTGGEREYGTLDATSYLKDVGATKPLSDIARQLGQGEDEVAEALLAMGIEPIDPEGDGESSSATGLAGMAMAEAERSVIEQAEEEEAQAPKKANKGGEKKTAKKAPKKAADAPTASATGKSALDDPNSFIKKNFQTMSNREMARETGLSEHTIRRKLGEWGLKRKATKKATGKKK
jgi:hypothetical protein